MDARDVRAKLEHVEADLVRELHLPPDRVHDAVERAAAEYATAPVQDFVPVLAGRRARAELQRA